VAEEAQDAADRSEAATPRRIERAREEGQVALSREAAGWMALLLSTLAAAVVLPLIGRDLLRAFRGVLEGAHALDAAEASWALAQLGALAVLPVTAAAAVGAVAGTLVQTRGLVSAVPLKPRLDKLDPIAALKRILGPEGLAEFVRSLIKLGLVGAALWHAVRDLPALQASLHQPAGIVLAEAGWISLRLMLAALVAFAAVALLDLVWVRFRHLRMLRMSRQELKEEARDSEGDPMLRARRRQLREQRGRRRMLADVPKAAVVVTNPTHYAVAVGYSGGDAAPVVLAKGVDAVAARIRAAAERAGVPLVSNPPLARALHRLELGAEIPAEHYQAVAEIIAFVWRRAGRAARA
jgi:flagellar biosynthetic protein FlhB